MRVILDTNILIPLESSGGELNSDLAEIIKLCSEQKITPVLHPLQIEDVNNDKIEQRKNNLLSRLKKYQQIENPPVWSADEIGKFEFNESKSNDHIDNALLCSIHRNAVNFLITEDEGIHKKAKKIGLQERVFYISSFLGYLKNNQDKETKPLLGIEECFVYELRIEDTFFDSLKKTYQGFNEWFAKIAKGQRKAWTVRIDNELMACVIWKEEIDPQFSLNKTLNRKVLKLCTFKVSPCYRGRKIGERLLHTAFNFASKNDYDHIYFTAVGKEQNMLISLCEDFGFYRFGKDEKTNDDVYVKNMKVLNEQSINGLENLEYAIRYHPHYKKDDCNKWIVPIQPQFHEQLFPDKQQQTLFDDDPNWYHSYQNTIKKAYVCNSQITKIKTGDLLYFYRSQDERSVRIVGVVEKSFHSTKYDEVSQEIAKRTVYSEEQIRNITNKKTFVILFRLMEYLPNEIGLNELIKKGTISAPPQSIVQLKGEI